MKRKLHIYEMISMGVLALLFCIIAWRVCAGGVIEMDNYIRGMVRGLQTEESLSFFSYFTKAGSGIGITSTVIISMIVFWKKRYFTAFIIYPIAVINTHFINQLLKVMIERERPSLNDAVDAVGYSFPSGHAMLSIVTYGFIAYMAVTHIKSRAGKFVIITAAVVWITSIGLSRIILNVHYPTDVIAGFCAGGIILIAAIYFNRLLSFRKS